MNRGVTYELYYTGFCLASESIAIRNGRRKPIRFHANCVLIKHPEEGYVLFDTGYSARFYEVTRKWPEKMQALATPATIAKSWSIVAQLEEKGITHEEIKHLVISHYHADHICGLKDFPKSKLYSDKSAYRQIKKLNRFSAIRKGLIKKLLPEDLSERINFFETLKKVEREDVFGFHYDFFGDGSIRVVLLPGHARGQVGLILNEGQANHAFLAADGFWLTRSLEVDKLPGSITRIIFDNWSSYKKTFKKIQVYQEENPACQLISCHCPRVFEATPEKIYS